MSAKRRIELYPKQHDFVACEDRFTAFIGGIGSGKTYAGAAKALAASSGRKVLGLVVAPTYPMLRDATLRTFLDVAGDAVKAFYKTEMRAELVNGSEILFRSADQPDRLRGPNCHFCWIDEGALCPNQTWDIVIGRLRAGGKAGSCWITTTPKGRNWLYQRLNLITLFKATTKDNPYLDPEFVASLEAAYTGKFAAQELSGEFVAFEGLVYEEFTRDVHVRTNAGLFVRYVAGVDEGYTNPAVILLVGFDSDDRAHVVAEYYRRRVLQDAFVKACQEFSVSYKFKDFRVDSSAAGLIAALGATGLNASSGTGDVMKGIQEVKTRLAIAGDGRPRLTVSPSCPNTIAEFESYCWAETKLGMKEEPVKENDHALDALRYVLSSRAGAPLSDDNQVKEPSRWTSHEGGSRWR